MHSFAPQYVVAARALSCSFMNEQTELLREMRDLLLVIAEPALAKRDDKLRMALRGVVGKSKSRGRAVLLMDGTRSQSAIKAAVDIDAGELSRVVKALRAESLLSAGDNPKLVIAIPPTFFEQSGERNDHARRRTSTRDL